MIAERAYRIETPRLCIRCWNPADAPDLRRALDESAEHLRPWMPWMKNELFSLDETVNRLRRIREHFDLGQDFAYGIFDPGGHRCSAARACTRA
ncbi:GNAT family N-acetyltransferase [Sorangium cellulosum]|uniref:GNAT family N-acetyltransferase n=1 Tax=Sorangium cellulosum TaxID=56 RepID=UPI003D9A2133